MNTRSILPWVMIALIAGLMAAAILAGFPPVYYGGLLVVIILAFLLIMKPFYFLIFLFAIRALCDNYFASIRFSIGGMDLGLGGLFSVFMIGVTFFYMATQKERIARLKHGTVVFYGLFCLYSLFSAYLSMDGKGAMKDLMSRYSVLSILIMTLLSVRDFEDAHKLLKAVVAAACLPVIVGFVKLALGITERLEGTLSHPNIMAYFLLIIMGAMVFQLHEGKVEKRWSITAYAYFILLLAGFVFTLTRSAWAAFAFMMGTYILFFKRQWFLPAAALAVASFFLPMVNERVTELFTTSGGSLQVTKSSSLGWRFDAWERFWVQAVKRPIFGHGINATGYVGNYHVEAHNDYLRFFLESGIFGIVLYFGTFVYTFLSARVNYARLENDAYLRRLSRFFLCYIPAFLLMSVSENLARYTTVNFYSMALLGVYVALDSIRKEGARNV